MKLKLSEKLKKLKLSRYRYKIITDEVNFYQMKYLGSNINIQNGKVVFYKNKIDKKKIQDDKCTIEDRYLKLVTHLFKTKIITSLSLIFILGLFIISNFFIREITFTNNETYNYNVLQDVKKEVVYIGPFMRLEKDLNELSNSLREKYTKYAYIGLRKKAGRLYIDIEEVEEYPIIQPNENKPTDIVSLVDGKVVGYEVEKGVPVVGINQIIKKGDVLISGNVNYQINPSNLENLVHSEGIVLIEYATYEQIVIPKETSFVNLNHSNKKYNIFYIFNKRVGKNRKEDINTFIVKNNIIDVEKIFRIEENVIYFKEEKTKKIVYKDAKVLSEQQIYSEFVKDKVASGEKIEFIKYINFLEDENQFIFYYLVKYIKNATIKNYSY